MMVPFSFLEIQLLYLMALCLIIILGLNWKLYRFFFEKRGFIFAAAAFPMHLLYYLWSCIHGMLVYRHHDVANPPAVLKTSTGRPAGATGKQ